VNAKIFLYFLPKVVDRYINIVYNKYINKNKTTKLEEKQMSKMTIRSAKFEQDCKSVATNVLSSWTDNVHCYYDGHPYFAKRDYVLKASHSWGTAYCDWSDKKAELFSALREAGATNIIGTVTYNRVDIAFDIKVSKLKEIIL